MKQGIKSREVVEYLAWLAVAAFFYGLSFSFAGSGDTETLAAEFWPRLFSLILILVATVHLARGSGEMGEPDGSEEAGPSLLSSLKLFVAPLLFVILIPRIGFYPSAVLFLLAQLLVLGERRPVVLGATTIGVAAAIFFVFTTLFYVAVPLGSWPFFNAMNGAFVTIMR
jgi:putative tricarboxylic transport membrane protein